MEPILSWIADGSGSGKTTVTRKLIEKLFLPKNPCTGKIVVIQHDSYYKDISAFGSKKGFEINNDHPDSLDTPLLLRHLKRLKNSLPIEKPKCDFTTYRRLKSKKLVQPEKVFILEGIFIFSDRAFRDPMDINVFIDTHDDERLLKRLRRDTMERGRSIKSVISQYTHPVKPMHLEFVDPSKRWADIVIPKGGENDVAIAMLSFRIRSLIGED